MGTNWDAVVRTFLNWSEVVQVFPVLLGVGLRNTLLLSAFAIALALVFGMFLALLLVSGNPFLRAPARVYVDVFRGMPAILTVLIVGTGLPIAGFRPFGRETYAYAVLALALLNGAYISEIFRSGIQSVEKGQMDAARGLGLSYLQTMRLVIVPQGIRRVLPALTNQFIVCVKESSFVYLLGLSADQRELFTIGQDQDAMTGGLTGLVCAGLVYLAIVLPMTYGVNWLDRRLRDGGASPVALPLGEAPASNVVAEQVP
jgi:polar amino acid transport system permease protein